MMEPPAEDCSQPKPVLIEPQPQVWVQPAAPMEMVPIMPLPESAGPRPEMLPLDDGGADVWGAMRRGMGPEMLPPPAEAGSPLENIAPGGSISPQFGLPRGPEAVPGGANPIFVPAANDEYAWEQIADVVSDYFTIAREQQVRRSGEAWSEGRIETQYQGGASWLEPFRKDSVGAFNRWESTFQTIRRKALVRVIPDANGYRRGSDRRERAGRLAASGAGIGRRGGVSERLLVADRAGRRREPHAFVAALAAAGARPGARGEDAGRHSRAAQRRDDGVEPVDLAVATLRAARKTQRAKSQAWRFAPCVRAENSCRYAEGMPSCGQAERWQGS